MSKKYQPTVLSEQLPIEQYSFLHYPDLEMLLLSEGTVNQKVETVDIHADWIQSWVPHFGQTVDLLEEKKDQRDTIEQFWEDYFAYCKYPNPDHQNPSES